MLRLELWDVETYCERLVPSLEAGATNSQESFDSRSVTLECGNFEADFSLGNEANSTDKYKNPWPPAYKCQDFGWEEATGLTEVGRRLVLLLFDAGLSTTILGAELDEVSLESTKSSAENMDPTLVIDLDGTRHFFVCKILATISIDSQIYRVHLQFESHLNDKFKFLSAVPEITQDIVRFFQKRVFDEPACDTKVDKELDRFICEAFNLTKILCSVNGYGIDLEPNRLMVRDYERDQHYESNVGDN